jgi:hypothetical protein
MRLRTATNTDATGPDTHTHTYTEATEYGIARANDPAPGRYGWLGGK